VGKIIAVASGKGGVGKSTVTANLALTLRNMGFRVGVLDADIYGPSQPKMFNREGYLPDAVQEDGQDYIVPAVSMDIELMSIGFFIQPNDALMWRGAMATSALKQLLHQTMWGGLDFLLIDMPPGTGDIQITLSQKMNIDEAVIVSTPQDIALIDAVKGVNMFKKTGVKIAGIIENMSYYICEKCGTRANIFGCDGAKITAERMGEKFLGEVPLHITIRENADRGTPVVYAHPDSEYAQAYIKIAKQLV
jgi:ATP-binding protein involved in chromosome partitioning